MLTELLTNLRVPTKVAVAAVAAAVAVGGVGAAAAVSTGGGGEPTVDATITSTTAESTTTTETTTSTTIEAEELESEVVEDLGGESPDPSEGQGPPEGKGPPEGTFGARVSADARDGGVDGPTIAAEARARAAERRADRGTGPEADESGSDRPDGIPPGPPAHAGRPGGR